MRINGLKALLGRRGVVWGGVSEVVCPTHHVGEIEAEHGRVRAGAVLHVGVARGAVLVKEVLANVVGVLVAEEELRVVTTGRDSEWNLVS